MPIHTLKLLAKREAAQNVFVFTFTKPDNFIFKPGQYGGFTLIQPSETDTNGITRRFSLLSSPHDPHLEIATRIQHLNTAFKRELNRLTIGSEIKFAGPTGLFTLHEDKTKPAVFIAGGIGIVPFHSMIKTLTLDHASQTIYLFYGNQSIQETAFLNELTDWQKQNPNFQLILTIANPPSQWKGETGFITNTVIKKYISNLDLPIYYICGSPAMVTTLQETLAEMEINEDNIKVEDFPGY